MPFRRENRKGILYMLIGVTSFGLMDVSIKVLMAYQYSPFQILAIRGWIMALFFAGPILYQRRDYILRMKHPLHHLLRAILGMGSSFFVFSALKYLSVATVSIFSFGSPFLMTLLSIFLFKDRSGWHRWMAIIGGFFGIFIASMHGLDTHEKKLGTFFAICGMFCYASWNLATRWMSKTETSESLIFSYMWMVALIATITLPIVWKPLTLITSCIVVLVSLFGFFGQSFVTKAYFHAEVGTVAPLEYLLFLIAAFGDYILWNNAPSMMTCIGCVIVIISGLIMLGVERFWST